MVLRRRLINPLSILCLPLPSAFAGGEAFPVTAQSRIMVSSLECFIGLWTPSISVGPRFSGGQLVASSGGLLFFPYRCSPTIAKQVEGE
uniref:Secreted protein n=1 Tax=Brassica campestris TaxID=3711 RepID=M4CIL4_BRACM